MIKSNSSANYISIDSIQKENTKDKHANLNMYKSISTCSIDSLKGIESNKKHVEFTHSLDISLKEFVNQKEMVKKE